MNMSEIVAGVDEAGVGPLAGPVVAAAVILNPKQMVYKLRDSKILTANQREILYDRIVSKCLAFSVGIASVDEIDQLNIYHANMLAMERAIDGLSLKPDIVLIDGRAAPKINLNIKTIVGGDKIIKSISAASIIAKVTRDRIMMEYHQQYPHYLFDKHKGYSTKEHQERLAQFGVCAIHRKSFARVRNELELGGESWP